MVQPVQFLVAEWLRLQEPINTKNLCEKGAVRIEFDDPEAKGIVWRLQKI